MTERDLLLKAVCENSDDDTPRLVFADWLQEHGDEARAEFIRLQIELARAEAFTPRVSALTTQHHKLRRLNEERWRAELPSDKSFVWESHFERGFIESLGVSDVIGFRRCAERVFASAPIIRVVSYHNDLGELAGIPELSRVRYLSVWLWHATRESVARFVAATNLAALEKIAIRGHTIDFALEDLLVERFGDKLLRESP
jgi:uncharacterized protein (TIGR02996 family)